MKKPLILFLIVYWLVEWNYVTETTDYDSFGNESYIRQKFEESARRDSFKEAIKLISEKKKDPKNKDFKLFRVEERSL